MKPSIFIICVLLELCLGNEPQVYENVDDQIQMESNNRVVRQPHVQTRPRVYHPPRFQYQEMLQQDLRKDRYAQQQRIDMINILKNQMIKPEAPLRVSLVENWKVNDPKITSSTIRLNYKIPEDRINITNYSKVSQTTKKPVTSRKMNPMSYYQDGGDKIKRQDSNQVVYVNPQVHNRRSEYDLNALNSLVGQDPNSQLQGLHRLLQTPQANIVLAPIKTPLPPHPITEDVEDIPNPNTHPNVDTQSLQNQLDEASKAQVAKAVAEAQQQAQVHVDAQYRALANLRAEAEKKALAQIALHNEGLKPEALPQPSALVSEVQPETLPQPLALKPEVPAYAASHGRHYTQQQYGDVKAALKPEVPVYATSHGHQYVQQQYGDIKATLKPEVPAFATSHGHQYVQQHYGDVKAALKPEVATSHGHQYIQQQFGDVKATLQPQVVAYVPSHGHRQQEYGELKAPKANLKKISITKTHSVTQRQSPNAYQQVVLETQQSQDSKVHQGVNQLKYADNVDEHQYAARYAFGYKIRDVKMGNEFGHEEKREGENAKGLYHVLLPDGRMQKVEYFAGPSGYHAKVTYENLAHH